jgi:hypothetical protein
MLMSRLLRRRVLETKLRRLRLRRMTLVQALTKKSIVLEMLAVV